MSLKWLLLLVAGSFISGCCEAQLVTIRGKGLAIAVVLEEVRKQTGYDMVFSPVVLAEAPRLDLDCRNATVQQVLDSCFAGLKVGYTIDQRVITMFRTAGPDVNLYLPAVGRVQSAEGEPLEGATISVPGCEGQITGKGGQFHLPMKARYTQVTFSFQGFASRSVLLANTGFQVIVLQPSVSVLDNVIVQAYGQTTQRLATGSVSSVAGTTIESQPAGNVLESLEGRVPGLVVRQYNGVPGSAFSTLIRGRHSIAQGTDPLIVVDGVPLPDNDGYLTTIGSGSAQGQMGASLLNGIPTSAIASVEVLKDAAATAIYGSRGANGVLLLTLKTGAGGTGDGLKWGADVYSGIDRVLKTSPLLNTTQYLGMREEAVENDGLPVDSSTVPELYLWDNTRSTNFKKLVMGNSALRHDARVELSGGDTNTVFLLSGNYYGQTSVFPGSTDDDRISLYGHLHQQSANRRLRFDVSALYNVEDNRLPIQDYTWMQYLAPDAPPFWNSAGQPVWNEGGLSFLNIPAQENNSYHARVSNFFGHGQLSYTLLPSLVLRSNLGYYRIASEEHSQLLIAGQDPATNPAGQTNFSGNAGHSEVIDGQAEFNHRVGPGRLDVLAGLDWEQQQTVYSSLTASGYTSDELLAAGGGNPIVSYQANNAIYRYEAVFGRLNYIFRDRYIATLSGRRDGSSRFSPGNQFGNFWAAGAAWIFSDESFFKMPAWISFGKLRSSLGTTGNDQIGDNTFASVYMPITAARGYQGLQGVVPTSYPNANLRWEVNYSSELALDLGFWENKLLLSAIAYRDWTRQQLLYSTLPAQSGLPGVIANLPADVVNEGLEWSLQADILNTRLFRWTSTFTLTVPVNRLASFPGLAASLYNNTLVQGRSLSVVKGYPYEGVNRETGLFQFRDDLAAGGNLDVHYYGSCEQSLRYKNWQLDLFLEFRRQSGVNPFVTLYQMEPPGFLAPAMIGNAPSAWLHRPLLPETRAANAVRQNDIFFVLALRVREYRQTLLHRLP